MKLKLRNKEFCDGCAELHELHTLAQHKRCWLYKINMLPQDDPILNRGGSLQRPQKCKDENEAEIGK